MRIYILTVTDGANFHSEEHVSVWDTMANAIVKGEKVKARLRKRDNHLGLGDTFRVDIECRNVGTTEDL